MTDTDSLTKGRKRWIRSYFRASWFGLTVSILISLTSVALQLLNPWPLKLLLDSVFGDVPAPGLLEPLTGTFTLLIIVAVAYVGIYILNGIVEIIDSYLTTRFTNKLGIKLQTRFFRHVLNLPIETRNKLESGDYVYRLNEQADNLAVIIFSTFVSILMNVVMVIVALVILALLDWRMAIIGILIVPILYLSIRFFTKRIESTSDAVAADTSEIYSRSSESLENATLIQSFNRQDSQTSKLQDLLKAKARKNMHLAILDSSFSFTNNISTATGTAIILVLGGIAVFDGTTTIGELIIFITYMGYLYDPIESIMSDIGEYKSLLAGVKLVHEVHAEQAEDSDPKVGSQMQQAKGDIAFRNVTFERDDKTILQNVNLDIQPRQKVAFIGPSGAGKSTVLSLVTRMSQPTSGTVYLDGQDVATINLNDFRNQFGVALQDAGMFSGTITDNIGFSVSNRQPTFDEVMRAAKSADAFHFINQLPKGFDTDVEEAGGNLSGGQRQRISLARTFIKDAPILVLDEPTSALDKPSAAKIIGAIKLLMNHKTLLLVTHDLSLLKEMDAVYIVDQGTVTKVQDDAQLESYVQSIADQSAEQAYDVF